MTSSRAQLTDLPEEVLVEIFQYCSAAEILTFGESCQDAALWGVIGNKKLWRTAEIKSKDMDRYIKYLGSHTVSLTLIGNSNKLTLSASKTSSMSEKLMKKIRTSCPNLVNLIITNCIMDSLTMRSSLFPKSLRSLFLDKVCLLNLAVKSCPYYSIKKSLPKLQKLEISNPVFPKSKDSLISQKYRKRP